MGVTRRNVEREINIIASGGQTDKIQQPEQLLQYRTPSKGRRPSKIIVPIGLTQDLKRVKWLSLHYFAFSFPVNGKLLAAFIATNFLAYQC